MGPPIRSWKKSAYALPIEVPDSGIFLIFSSFTGRLVEIPPSYRPIADDLLTAPNEGRSDQHEKLRTTLIQQGILIPMDFDEAEHLREGHIRSKSIQSQLLGLTICPTVGCNFRCTYCYQDHPSGLMGVEVRDRLVDYVARYRPLEKLSVTWFGGEPLIGMEVIEDLSVRFLEGPYQYEASIITNGSRLTPETSRRLVALKIAWAQITLDGPRELHDQRRPLAGGQPTFDRILGHIKEADPGLAISIRVNVDSRNAGGVATLLDQLDDAGLQGRVSVYFAPVAPYTKVCADVVDHCVTGKAWAQLHTQLSFLATQRGFADASLPSPRTHVCLADRASDFVVVPSGLVYNCWNDVTDPSRAIFDLLSGTQSNGMKANLQRWAEWGPFQFEDCRSCHVLPLCMGGCPHLSMQLNRGACGDLRHNVRDRVLMYYLAHKRGEALKELHEAVTSRRAENISLKAAAAAVARVEPTGGRSHPQGSGSSARAELEVKVLTSLRQWAAAEHSKHDKSTPLPLVQLTKGIVAAAGAALPLGQAR